VTITIDERVPVQMNPLLLWLGEVVLRPRTTSMSFRSLTNDSSWQNLELAEDVLQRRPLFDALLNVS
jgi:hypothetical protein